MAKTQDQEYIPTLAELFGSNLGKNASDVTARRAMRALMRQYCGAATNFERQKLIAIMTAALRDENRRAFYSGAHAVMTIGLKAAQRDAAASERELARVSKEIDNYFMDMDGPDGPKD